MGRMMSPERGRMWAKRQAGKILHKDPLLQQLVEVSSSSGSKRNKSSFEMVEYSSTETFWNDISNHKLSNTFFASTSTPVNSCAVRSAVSPHRTIYSEKSKGDNTLRENKNDYCAQNYKQLSDKLQGIHDRLQLTPPRKYLNNPPTPPERHDSLSESVLFEDEGLRDAPWFQAGIPREIALEILFNELPGAFIVRESVTKPGCFALSLRAPKNSHPNGIAHYLILKNNGMYRIKGFTKEFSSLRALITHHSVMQESLPCPLNLPRPPSRSTFEEDFADLASGT